MNVIPWRFSLLSDKRFLWVVAGLNQGSTLRFDHYPSGSKIARLSWSGTSTVRRSFCVSAVKTTFLRKSPLLLTYQMAPVIDAATLMACTFPTIKTAVRAESQFQ
jgi:hypothetical protein